MLLQACKKHGSPGESTHFRKGTLARGMARPGKAPTSGSPEVLCPRGTQDFGYRPGLGETPKTTTVSSLCTNGSYLLNTQVGRVYDLMQQDSPPRSGLCRIYCVACGNRPHN